MELIYLLLSMMPLPADVRAGLENREPSDILEGYVKGEFCKYCPAMPDCNNPPALIAREQMAGKDEIRKALGAIGDTPIN